MTLTDPKPRFQCQKSLQMAWQIDSSSSTYHRKRGHVFGTQSTSNNSKTVPDRAIFTMADQQKVACGLSNSDIF